MKIYIYSLSNPITNEVKYIGKTNNPRLRLNSHISTSKQKNIKRYVCDWIRGLLDKGLLPEMLIIEETDELNWVAAEKYWISHFKSLGAKLCNLTDGGESNNGYVYSEELKEIRRKARLGYTIPDNVKIKIAKSLSRKIFCIEDNIIFNSMKEAIEYSKIPRSSFHRKLHKGEKINKKTYIFYDEN